MRRPLFSLSLIAGLALIAGAAIPAAPPADCGVALLHPTMLRDVNAARAAGRRCGVHAMAPAPPVTWSRPLEGAAAAHSWDMAGRNYFDHNSPEGTQVAQRVAAKGYNWRTVGENIAGGDTTAEGVLRGWLASPAHCENIMSPAFADMAVACAWREGSQWGTYWTMVLAARR